MKSNHEKHEVIDFLNQYVLHSNILINIDSFIDEEFIKNIIYNIDYKENFRPDGFSIIDDNIYPIEHFQFDASVENRGSQLSKEISLLDKKTMHIRQTTSSVIETNSDINCYMSNLINHFVDHADKITDYSNNINKLFPYKINKGFIFFVEDKTIFGAMTIEQEPFQIVLTQEFIDVWKNYPEIKYIFMGGSFKGNNYCIVYSNLLFKKKFNSITKAKIIIMNSAHVIDVMEEIKWKK